MSIYVKKEYRIPGELVKLPMEEGGNRHSLAYTPISTLKVGDTFISEVTIGKYDHSFSEGSKMVVIGVDRRHFHYKVISLYGTNIMEMQLSKEVCLYTPTKEEELGIIPYIT